MFKPHNHCRACGLGKPQIPTLKQSSSAGPQFEEHKLVEVLDLGLMPLANDFVEQGHERAGYAPLKLMWCPRCTLAQLSVVVSPEVLYANYPYVTSKSQMMKDHFAKLAADLIPECASNGLVVEIGSNDGTLLEFLFDHGFKEVLGIEPAKNLAKLAKVPTWNMFFDASTASKLSGKATPDLIIARHVFCHIDDWGQTVKNLESICGKETVIAIEVPYFIDTLLNVEWDQIYHEHTSYLTLKSINHLLDGTRLHVHTAIRYSIHGGAVMLLLKRNDSAVERVCVQEEKISEHDMKFFAHQARMQISALKETVEHLNREGKTVVGYGASAKATQWIHACGFTRKHIKFVCDVTPQKQYKLMPGSDIPVVDPGALTRDLPDYAICFAWNFADEIIANEKIFKAKGGRWIIPHGDIKIV